MATVYIHPTLGDDTRTYAQAQSLSPFTPWKTPMQALNGATVDDDVVRVGRPGDGALTWLNADAVCDSMGLAGTGPNKSKRLTWLVSSGVTAVFSTETGAAYLPGKFGTAIDSEGPDVHPVRGHCWRLVNPKQGMTFYWNTDPGASVEFKQTGTLPDEVGGAYSSCFYFVNKSAQAGTSGRVYMTGLNITRYEGNGVMYFNVPPGYQDNFDISHTMTGLRWEGASCNGKGQSTTLNSTVAVGSSSLTVLSTTGFTQGDLVRIGGGALDRDTEFRLVAGIPNSTTLNLSPGPSGRTGLHYQHLSGTEVSVSYGPRFGRTHHNDTYGIVGAGGFGGEGMSFNKLPTNVMAFRVQSDTNYGRIPHLAFGVDGGYATPYAQGDNCGLTECIGFDSHSLLESGTDHAALPTAGARFIYTFNATHGKIDQQAVYGNAATAAALLARAVQGWLVRRNTFVLTNGELSDAGIRWSRTGSSTYEDGIDDFNFTENIVYMTFDSSFLGHAGDIAFPATSLIDRNIMFRTVAGTDPGARHYNGSTTYAFNATGKGQYTTATGGFETNSQWNVDPLLNDPLNGDLSLKAASPARFMALDGGAIGAFDFISQPTNIAGAQAAIGAGAAISPAADVGQASLTIRMG